MQQWKAMPKSVSVTLHLCLYKWSETQRKQHDDECHRCL